MAQLKKTERGEGQRNHAATISSQDLDEQLRAYMMSQYQQHLDLRKQHETNLSPEDLDTADLRKEIEPKVFPEVRPVVDSIASSTGVSSTELYEDGVKEIFGSYQSAADTKPVTTQSISPVQMTMSQDDDRDVGALSIAYSKLPMILRSRKSQTATR